MVGLTIARDFLYIVRSAALGDHHPVTSIEIIQQRLSSPVSNVDQNGTVRPSGNQYRDHPATFIQSSIERIPERNVQNPVQNTRTEQWDQRNPVTPVQPVTPSIASIARDIHQNVERVIQNSHQISHQISQRIQSSIYALVALYRYSPPRFPILSRVVLPTTLLGRWRLGGGC